MGWRAAKREIRVLAKNKNFKRYFATSPRVSASGSRRRGSSGQRQARLADEDGFTAALDERPAVMACAWPRRDQALLVSAHHLRWLALKPDVFELPLAGIAVPAVFHIGPRGNEQRGAGQRPPIHLVVVGDILSATYRCRSYPICSRFPLSCRCPARTSRAAGCAAEPVSGHPSMIRSGQERKGYVRIFDCTGSIE